MLFNNFQQLADKFILGIWPFYALAVGAVFILRRTRPDHPRPYRTVGYPVVPAIFLIASLLILGNALVEQPLSTAVGFGIILAGIPVFYYGASSYGKNEKTGKRVSGGGIVSSTPFHTTADAFVRRPRASSTFCRAQPET
mgnify:CR=1 FL=1